MAFGTSFNYAVRSFEQIENRYNSTKPVREKDRGIQRDIRPMNHRTNKHIRVEKISDDEYGCVLYGTRCLTYHRDGSINITTGGYVTQSTTMFLGSCLPQGWWASRTQEKLHIYRYTDKKYYIVGDKEILTIKDYDTDNPIVTGAQIPTKKVVNRAETKVKRDMYKPFLSFAQGFMEVLNIDVPKPDRTDYYATSRLRNEFLDKPETIGEDRYLELLSALCASYWRGQTYKQIKSMLYRTGTVHDIVEMEIGKKQRA
jgi:hypothetical protein